MVGRAKCRQKNQKLAVINLEQFWTQHLKIIMFIESLTAQIPGILITHLFFIDFLPVNRRAVEHRNFVCWIKFWSCFSFRGNIAPKVFVAIFRCMQFILGDRHCITKAVLIEMFLNFLVHVWFKLTHPKPQTSKQLLKATQCYIWLLVKTSAEAASWFHQLKSQVEFFCVFSPDFLREALLLSLAPFSFLSMSLGPLPLVCAPFTSKTWRCIIWDRYWLGSTFGHKHPTKRPLFLSVLPQATPQFSWFYLMATFCSLWGIMETIAELIMYVPF